MKVRMIIFCIFFLVEVRAQEEGIVLPTMTDWFLATGDWHNDPQLYVRELGSPEKDPIIMLHGGWGGSHDGLIDAVNGLMEDHRFIFYEQRGSLRSPCPDSLITFDLHIEDLERLRKELELEQLTIIGHSMGTILASAYAHKYPGRIKKLILLAPAYLKNPIPAEAMQVLNEQRVAHQGYMSRPKVAEQLEKYALSTEGQPLNSRGNTAKFRINFANRMLYHIEKWPQLGGGRALYKGKVFGLTEATYPKEGWDYLETFSQADYPVGIIVGDHDFLDFGNGVILKWVGEVPSIKISIIEKAGHILWIDQPKLFTLKLKELLAE